MNKTENSFLAYKVLLNNFSYANATREIKASLLMYHHYGIKLRVQSNI